MKPDAAVAVLPDDGPGEGAGIHDHPASPSGRLAEDLAEIFPAATERQIREAVGAARADAAEVAGRCQAGSR